MEVVLWVCADMEDTAKPKNTVMAPRIGNVFISNKWLGFNLLRADKVESWRATDADVETGRATAKVNCS